MNLQHFSEQLIHLSLSAGTDDFYAELKSVLDELVKFDELLVLKFRKDRKAELLYQYSSNAESEADLQNVNKWNYLSSLYVLDPYYRAFADKNQYGFFTKKDVSPDRFDQIYNAYFHYLKLADEIGFLFELENGACLHIDLSRFGDSPKFTLEDTQRIAQMYRPLKELFVLHTEHILEAFSAQPQSVDIEKVLSNFGAQILTNKEFQVCQFLLQGHSTKAIANIMGIGMETVKMHKKNVYGKSFISSQAELLAAFIDVIQQPSLDPNIDYLQSYNADI